MFQTTKGLAIKSATLALLATVLVGCGGYQTRSVGLEEQTLLIIRGENLVGLTVDIKPAFSKQVAESDLTEYTMGIAGAANKEAEDLQTITFKVESGPQHVVVSKGGVTLVERRLQFSHGQTRELRIYQ